MISCGFTHTNVITGAVTSTGTASIGGGVSSLTKPPSIQVFIDAPTGQV
jgi:hypothetical protein